VIYGYARVSTTGQTLDAQLKQLQAEGCAKIYREKQSGARRPARAAQAPKTYCQPMNNFAPEPFHSPWTLGDSSYLLQP
jgi:Resolvase, N terminal domain